MNIAGKDWLTVDEAAHYCGVSNSQFRKHAASYGICPRNFMGKQLYEKNALYTAIANSPTWGGAGALGASVVAPTSSASMNLAAGRLRRYEKRKGLR